MSMAYFVPVDLFVTERSKGTKRGSHLGWVERDIDPQFVVVVACTERLLPLQHQFRPEFKVSLIFLQVLF